MSNSKPRNKRDPLLVEPCIYSVVANGKIVPNLYDVKVRKRLEWRDQKKQVTRFKRKVHFLTEARKVKDQFIKEILEFEDEMKNGNVTWKQAKIEYFKDREKEVELTTYENQKSIVNKHTATWDSMRLSEFKQQFIANDLRAKLTDHSKSTVKSTLKHIRAVFEWHFHKVMSPLSHNPCKGIKIWGRVDESVRQEIPKMNMDSIQKLLTHTKGTIWFPLFYLAYHTGLRSGELWALKWSDIDEKFEYLTVNFSYNGKHEKRPKNGSTRKVAIHAKLAELLKELKSTAHLKTYSKEEYVLEQLPMWRDGKAATVLRQFQKELGIPPTSFHAIRASHITHLLLKGVSPIAVMYSVGHSDFKTTERYIREIGKERSIANMNDVLMDEVIPANVINIKKA